MSEAGNCWVRNGLEIGLTGVTEKGGIEKAKTTGATRDGSIMASRGVVWLWPLHWIVTTKAEVLAQLQNNSTQVRFKDEIVIRCNSTMVAIVNDSAILSLQHSWRFIIKFTANCVSSVWAKHAIHTWPFVKQQQMVFPQCVWRQWRWECRWHLLSCGWTQKLWWIGKWWGRKGRLKV